ncbi:hypothetical protein FH972_021787 [Carpinus fangiana]|uniref:Carboxypeptidase n=1 Tax=Carpinus fangiana TaxID=176857 RepID=A0A5N6KQW3_9ROSI|nr:hypothetical protein FH972_021787 [Carpinus fangiana]
MLCLAGKMAWSSTLLAAVLTVGTTTAQFVKPPTDLKTAKGYAGINVRYKQVPNGICETRAHVKSFTGYSDVAENEHIFWWFFEAREVDPSEAPLTVWINGGPGSSSMIGLFQELGPCGINSEGKVYDNPYAWNRKSNILFVDQPTTVGLSYSIPQDGYTVGDSGDFITLPPGTCPDYAAGSCLTQSSSNETLTANSTAGAAPNMWKTLQGFMGAFPKYSRNGFHFTTESYGGHYGPVFNEYFEQQNKKNIPGAHKIALQSVAIGNGWFDPLVQYEGYFRYIVEPGNTYDYKPYNKSTEAMVRNSLYGKGNCLDQIKYCQSSGINEICTAADNFCANYVESILDNVANRDEYDIRELMPDPFPYSFFEAYLNTPKVQKAIGAFQNYSSYSYTTGNAFGTTGDDARESMTIEDVQLLLKQGVRVMMYFGDAGMSCLFLTV